MRETENINQILRKVWPLWTATQVIGKGSYGGSA